MVTVTYKNNVPRHEPLRIGIIGLGSCGLSILERLLFLSARRDSRLVQIVIFEPNEPGTGIHNPDQPDYLLLNTIACQLSMFPDEAAIGSREERLGPNFYTWCNDRGIRIGEDGFPCYAGGRPVAPTDFLPRRLIGEYLAWVYRKITTDIPANVEINLYREKRRALFLPSTVENTWCAVTQAPTKK